MRRIFTLLTVLAIVSCGAESFDIEAETDKVLDIHDEVMPKIGQVMNLKKEVLAKASEVSDEAADELRDLASDLEEAQEGMMQWMRQWGEVSKPHLNGETTTAEVKSFFKDQIEKVTEVKDKINSSIAAANKALE